MQSFCPFLHDRIRLGEIYEALGSRCVSYKLEASGVRLETRRDLSINITLAAAWDAVFHCFKCYPLKQVHSYPPCCHLLASCAALSSDVVQWGRCVWSLDTDSTREKSTWPCHAFGHGGCWHSCYHIEMIWFQRCWAHQRTRTQRAHGRTHCMFVFSFQMSLRGALTPRDVDFGGMREPSPPLLLPDLWWFIAKLLQRRTSRCCSEMGQKWVL